MTATETAEARARIEAALADADRFESVGVMIKSADLRLLLTPPAQGEEWRWVPVEPTEAMLSAWALSDKHADDWRADCISGWTAMLSAIPDASPGSPSAPTAERLRRALEIWDRQATCWFDTREPHAKPAWMKVCIEKGRAALSDAGEERA